MCWLLVLVALVVGLVAGVGVLLLLGWFAPEPHEFLQPPR